jgi:hypothetical protein
MSEAAIGRDGTGIRYNLKDTGLSQKELARLILVGKAMRNRCYRPGTFAYDRYGGRGITVCDEWLRSTKSFVVWAIETGYKPGLQIDRIDNDGPYSPTNCRWVTPQQNARNRGLRIDNKSGFKGVQQRGKRWRAAINGRFFGVFDTAEEAARAYDAKAIELHGEFARLNFPLEVA